MPTTELVRHTTGEITPDDAKRISRSKLIPELIADDPASAEYMMRIGAALGLDPTSAFQHIFVFPDKGGRLKAGMSAHLMHALAVGAGHTLHVEGDAIKATAVLVRNTSLEDLHRFQVMREEERRQKLGLLQDLSSLYEMQRQQILDRIKDLQALAELGGEPAEDQIKGLHQQLADLHKPYDFDTLRQQVMETKFDLTKLTRFESTWSMQRAQKAGLSGKDVWAKFGPEMLKARAKASVVRDGAIDVILGIKRIMGDLGVEFSDEVDDNIAVANVLYTPEEMGVDVDESGVPLKGRVVNVTAPGVSKEQDRLVRTGRKLVKEHSPEWLCEWAGKQVGNESLSADDKISRVDAVAKAVKEAEEAEEPGEKKEELSHLFTHLESTIDSLR